MARSKYIYIALDRNGAPTAAFTVKYELGSWLRSVLGVRDAVAVIRFRDGGSSVGQPMDPWEAREW